MNRIAAALVSATLLIAAGTAIAQGDMKKDDAMMKMDKMCADMMKKEAMSKDDAASAPMKK